MRREQIYCGTKCAKKSFKIINTDNYKIVNTGGNNPRAIKIICIETNEIFDCIKDAYISLGISKYAFNQALKLNQPINGYHYEKIKK